MSHLREPDPVKLIAGLFSADKEQINTFIGQLKDACGAIDWISPELFFDRTRYYESEMGWPLHRRFVSFKDLVSPTRLVPTKLKTHAMERNSLVNGNRTINIDPGYLSSERLILATGKNFTHRVYLSHGVYADLTLIYQKGAFRPLDWTYPDYAGAEISGLFNEVRKRYIRQLNQSKKGGKPH